VREGGKESCRREGKIVLLEAFVVCTKGKAITPEQAKLM